MLYYRLLLRVSLQQVHKKDFGAPTTAELETETTSFYFNLGGFFGDNYMIMIVKPKDGAAVNFSAGAGYLPDEPIVKEELGPDEWRDTHKRCLLLDGYIK